MLHPFLGTELLTINNLLFKAQIDNINLFKVVNKNHDAVVTQTFWLSPSLKVRHSHFSYRNTLRRAWSAERYVSRLYKHWLLDEINVPPLHLQLGGFVEKYAGSGVTLHPQSSSNKENRRTEGLNRYLQTLQSNQSTVTGRTVSLVGYVVFAGGLKEVLIEI